MKYTAENIKSQAEKQSHSRSLVKGSYLKTGYKIKVFENSLYFQNDVDRQHRSAWQVSPRGDVTSFSHNSRKRLIRLFSRIQISCYKKAYFLTLTYHEAWREADFCPAKDLNTFLQSIRDNFTDFDFLWRLEFQKRGAPHYHIMFFFRPGKNIPAFPKFLKHCVDAWHRIADPDSADHAFHGVDGAQLNDYRHAFTYCSKYSAKEESQSFYKWTGRRWGASKGLSLRPVLSLELPYAQYMQLRELCRILIMSRANVSAKFIQYLSDPYTCHLHIDFNHFVAMYDAVFKSTCKKPFKNMLECIWIYQHWEPKELAYLKIKSVDLPTALPTSAI